MSGDKPPRLEGVERVDLPVVEASGVAARSVSGRIEVLVVGDRTDEVAVGTYDRTGSIVDWTTIDLASLPGWVPPPGDSQLEAIAVDGGSLVAFMREDPPLVLVADTSIGSIVARISLTAPAGSPLHGSWDDRSSRGEGMVLLRDGRLLVAKEKQPRALIEFAPVGADARGLSREILLGPDERWEHPTGAVEYAAVAMWKLRGAAKRDLDDISALAVGRHRDMWLLSDRSKRLARLSLDIPLAPPTGEIREFQEIWRLPKKTNKPEGLAALDDRHLLIAMDTNSTDRNGVIARRPQA